MKKKNFATARISEQQEKQLNELVEMGFGNQSDVIRIAIDRLYQQEIRKRRKDYVEELARLSNE
ncbi:MAG: hypothetical protein ACP5D6_11415 [Kosmotogaceae bacterium]